MKTSTLFIISFVVRVSCCLYSNEERERRLRNLSQAVGLGLLKEIERHKNSLSHALSEDFKREINLADRCVYTGDFDGSLYHGLIADMITVIHLECIKK